MHKDVPRVVLGLDESTPASAVGTAARQAAELGARLEIIHAYAFADYSPLIGRAREQLNRMLDGAAAVARAAAPGLEVLTTVADGMASAVLAAESRSAELVVIGHRGLGPVAARMAGATGLALTGHTGCPLLVVGPARNPHGPVVVGVDDPVDAAGLLDAAFARAGREGRALTVVHAWHLPFLAPRADAPGYGREAIEATLTAAVAAEVDLIAQRHHGVRATCTVRVGRPATVLTEAAATASLLIIGAGRAENRHALTLGSTAAALVRRAPCPVLVLPTGSAQGAGDRSHHAAYAATAVGSVG